MNGSWSPQQRQWLEALGHDVLVLAGAEALPVATAGRPAPTPPRQPAPAAGESPLLRALLRAAGRRNPADLAWLPDPGALRGNAAAKRALWPRLRSLRKSPGDA